MSINKIASNYIVYTDDDEFKSNLELDEDKIIVFKNIQNSLNINFVILENKSLTLKIITDGVYQNIKMSLNLNKNSSVSVYFLDFSKKDSNIKIDAYLLESGANFNYKCATLGSNVDKKNIEINVYHLANLTTANVENYGICKDQSHIQLLGCSKISEEMIKCSTQQRAKILILDQGASGIAKPILKIENDDVVANHGASIGQLNEDHLFYLLSRGLSIKEAKRLIILGYFNNIVSYFKDDEFYDDINNLVLEKV